LKPGQSKKVEVTIDPRLLATYEAAGNKWHIRSGDYRLMLGDSSDGEMQTIDVNLPDATWSAAKIIDR
jgi:beta-glucosidase